MFGRSPDVTYLHSTPDAEAMLAASEAGPVALLKHSSMCPLSARAAWELRGLKGSGLPLYVVVVQEARAVSNWLEGRLGVRHETPQAHVLVGGRSVLVQNHARVRADALRAAAVEAAAVEAAAAPPPSTPPPVAPLP